MPETPSDASPRHVFTPSSLNRLARDLIEDALGSIWIEGELSNVARPASGHLYFTLKDSAAQVRCAMFRPRSTWLPFRPVDGMQVLVRARASVYEARGEFQVVAEHMELAGEGALRREYEALKARLEAAGLFDPARKRPLPARPQRIGVITSPSGAAVRDVLHVLARRFPLVEVEILPVPVQGREAPPAIVAMLRAASAAARHDVLVLARGGGSLEDLWAFNDEGVAHAIAASAIPVVSAIGHETDFTIADFVADLRAATPSAAAERLVPDRDELARHLTGHLAWLGSRMKRRLEASNQRLDHLHARLQAQRPSARLARGARQLDEVRARLLRAIDAASRRVRVRLDGSGARMRAAHPRKRLDEATRRGTLARRALEQATLLGLDRRRRHLAELARTLHAVSPLATLSRGYAILLEPATRRVMRGVDEVRAAGRVTALLGDGEIMLGTDTD